MHSIITLLSLALWNPWMLWGRAKLAPHSFKLAKLSYPFAKLSGYNNICLPSWLLPSVGKHVHASFSTVNNIFRICHFEKMAVTPLKKLKWLGSDDQVSFLGGCGWYVFFTFFIWYSIFSENSFSWFSEFPKKNRGTHIFKDPPKKLRKKH